MDLFPNLIEYACPRKISLDTKITSCDLKLAFLAKDYIYVQILKAIGLSPGQHSSSFVLLIWLYMTGFGLSPEVLEGLGSSGRLVGNISTYPGTYQCR